MKVLVSKAKVQNKGLSSPLKSLVDKSFPSSSKKEAILSGSRSDNKSLPLSILVTDLLNNRHEEKSGSLISSRSGALQLMDSMKHDGLRVPITVFIPTTGSYKDRYVVVDGHQRLNAAQKLGWKTIPCRVYYDLSMEDASCIAIVANIGGDATKRNLTASQRVEAVLKAKQSFKTPTSKIICEKLAVNQARLDGRSQEPGYIKQLSRLNTGWVSLSLEAAESSHVLILLRREIIANVTFAAVVSRFFLRLDKPSADSLFKLIAVKKVTKEGSRKNHLQPAAWSNFSNEVGPDPGVVSWDRIKKAALRHLFSGTVRNRVTSETKRLVKHYDTGNAMVVTFMAKFKTNWTLEARRNYEKKVKVQFDKFMKSLRAGRAL